jgi:hypothetical protein
MGLREAGKPVVVSMGNCAASGKHLISGQSSQAICLSVPISKQNLPLSLAACKDTAELVAKFQQHKHDHLLRERPECVARLAAHAWLHLCCLL